MSIGELIELLQKYDKSLPVMFFCDGYGFVKKIDKVKLIDITENTNFPDFAVIDDSVEGLDNNGNPQKEADYYRSIAKSKEFDSIVLRGAE